MYASKKATNNRQIYTNSLNNRNLWQKKYKKSDLSRFLIMSKCSVFFLFLHHLIRKHLPVYYFVMTSFPISVHCS